jgi:hypothetical protein
MPITRETILAACRRYYSAHRDDCAAFLRAVAADLGFSLTGNADALVAELSRSWTRLTREQAIAAAEAGQFVVVGLRSRDFNPPGNHGHVGVVVPGPLRHGLYPPVWCGSIGHVPSSGNLSVSGIWRVADRNRVLYFTPRAPEPAR